MEVCASPLAQYATISSVMKNLFMQTNLSILEQSFYMHKVLKLLLFILISSAPFFIKAQNKYAVLVGINDYYSVPGTKHPSSLHGCVNDAESMNELLVYSFGINAANIRTLYD